MQEGTPNQPDGNSENLKDVMCEFVQCIETQDLESLSLLVERGFDVNTPTCDEAKSKFRPVLPLHQCIQNHWVEGARVLLEAGADFNLVDPMEGDYRMMAKTPLVRAICEAQSRVTHGSADLRMMDLLAQYKPSIDGTASTSKQTPLLVAVCLGFEEAVKWLLEHGADPNIVSRFSPAQPSTPLSAALRSFTGYTVQNKDEFDEDDQINLRLDRSYNMIKLLMSHNADPNLGGSDITPLMSAASSADLRPLEFLLQHGADVNSIVLAYNEVDSALVSAISSTNVGAVALLLSHGVSTDRYVKLEAYWGKKQLFSFARYALRTPGEASHRLKMAHMLLLAGCKFGEPTVSLLQQLARRFLPELQSPVPASPTDNTTKMNTANTNGNWDSDDSECGDSDSDEEEEEDEDYDDDAIKIVIRMPYEETIDNDMLCFTSFVPTHEDLKVLRNMVNYVTQPKTLKQSCRLCIRSVLHYDKVEQLPIPQLLQDFISFREAPKR